MKDLLDERRTMTQRAARCGQMEHRVLLVDDDEALGELTVLALKRRGFEVTWRGSAEAAWELVRQPTHFDVAVVDVGLEGQSGLAFAERLLEARPKQRIVVLSGDVGAEPAARRLGATSFLLKPVSLEMLEATLRAALPSD